MTRKSSVDQAALAFKILDGKASQEEQLAFEAWLSQKQEHWEEFADLKLLWENSAYKSNEADPDAFEQIKKIVEADRKKRTLVRFILYSLAVIVLGVLIYFVASRLTEAQQVNLRFDNVTIDSIIHQVESMHHVKIECDNSIRRCRFSGIFYRYDGPETIFRAIAESLNIQVLNSSVNTFRLTGTGC